MCVLSVHTSNFVHFGGIQQQTEIILWQKLFFLTVFSFWIFIDDDDDDDDDVQLFTCCILLCGFSDDPDVFVYTNQGGSPTVDSIDDEDDFSNVRNALTLMGTLVLSSYANP